MSALKSAIRKTVRQLRQDKYAPQYAGTCKALNLLLANICEIEEAEEKKHNKIINEIGSTDPSLII
jgi:hypothetical protein